MKLDHRSIADVVLPRREAGGSVTREEIIVDRAARGVWVDPRYVLALRIGTIERADAALRKLDPMAEGTA